MNIKEDKEFNSWFDKQLIPETRRSLCWNAYKADRESQLQTKDKEIETALRNYSYLEKETDRVYRQMKTKDALIKELIECVERDQKHILGVANLVREYNSDYLAVGELYEDMSEYKNLLSSIEKSRTLLNSEAVKEWRGEK